MRETANGTLTGELGRAAGKQAVLDSVQEARFEAVVRRSSERIIQMLDFVFLDRELAADAAQDAFVQLYLHWDEVGGSAEPEAWLYRVAVNRCKDYRRRLTRGAQLIRRLAAASPPQAVGGGWEPADDFLAVLRQLQRPLPPPVDQVLASIDSVGLAAIIAQAGVGLEDSAELENAFDPGVEGLEVGEKHLVWSFTAVSYYDDPITVAALAPNAGAILRVSDRRVDRLESAESLSSWLLPTQGAALSLAWAWRGVESPEPEGDLETTPFATPRGINEIGAPVACVMVGPLSPEQDSGDKVVAPQPVGAQLDGLAFVSDDGRIYHVTNGSANEIEGATSCTGVSYSLGRGWLVHSPLEPSCPVDIAAVAAGEDGETQRLLTHTSYNAIVNACYDETADQIWFAYCEGDDNYTLWTTKPQTSDPVDDVLEEGTSNGGSKDPVSVPLSHDCGGDFTVSPDGSAIVYLGPRETPVRAFLQTQEGEAQLALELATACSPVFSPDGNQICLVGSKEAAGETSLWIYDRQTGNCTQLKTTEGLDPTYPVFSPDGRRIAFRNWKLGDLWTVDVDRGTLTRYALSVGEAPIAW